MSDIPCPVCGDPTPDGLLCRPETARLRANLRRLPEAMDELAVNRRRQATAAVTGARGSGTPLQFGFDASLAHEAVIGTLLCWIGELAEEAGEELYRRTPVQCECRPPFKITSTSCPRVHGTVRIDYTPGDTVEAWCDWLIERIPRIRRHISAAQIVDELTDAANLVSKTTDRPRGQVYVCACALCGTPLFATEGAQEVTCKKCRRVATDMDPASATYGEVTGFVPTYRLDEENERRLAALKDSLLPVADVLTAIKAIKQIEVSRNTIWSWVRRTRLPARACRALEPIEEADGTITHQPTWKRDKTGRVEHTLLYHVNEALELAQQIPIRDLKRNPGETKPTVPQRMSQSMSDLITRITA